MSDDDSHSSSGNPGIGVSRIVTDSSTAAPGATAATGPTDTRPSSNADGAASSSSRRRIATGTRAQAYPVAACLRTRLRPCSLHQ